jgi:hypothetical protein
MNQRDALRGLGVDLRLLGVARGRQRSDKLAI